MLKLLGDMFALMDGLQLQADASSHPATTHLHCCESLRRMLPQAAAAAASVQPLHQQTTSLLGCRCCCRVCVTNLVAAVAWFKNKGSLTKRRDRRVSRNATGHAYLRRAGCLPV
jgi:hypothetical protein